MSIQLPTLEGNLWKQSCRVLYRPTGAAGLRDKYCSTLHTLHLHMNNIGDSGAKVCLHGYYSGQLLYKFGGYLLQDNDSCYALVSQIKSPKLLIKNLVPG